MGLQQPIHRIAGPQGMEQPELAQRLRRRRPHAPGAIGFHGGNSARRRTDGGAWGHPGSCPDVVRHAGAEGGVPSQARSRRNHLLPGLQRAGLRLRPCLHADHRRARRRQMGDQWTENLDHGRREGRLHVASGAHRSDSAAAARRHQPLHRANEDPGSHGAPVDGHVRAHLLPGISRQCAGTCACTGR
ncbi:hypothetical protein D3C71_1454420 [compost metagenome]